MSRDIYHMISDYFCGKISERDGKILDEWKNASPTNRTVFSEMEKVWKLTGTLKTDIRPDLDNEWERFKQLRENPFVKTHRIHPVFLKIAAVLFPFIVVFTAYFYFHERTSGYLTVRSEQEQVSRILPDGTEILLNRNSEIRFPEKFGKKQRIVKISGEVYLKVAKTGIPFIADAGKTKVKVLGTAFTVRNYENEKFTEVTVREGKVLFSAKNAEQQTYLVAGEKALYTETSSMVKSKITNENSFAWVNKKLVFEETPLNRVSSDIENYFGKTVVASEHIKNCLFTGEFSQPALQDVMDILSLTFGSTWEMRNDTIILSGGSCQPD